MEEAPVGRGWLYRNRKPIAVIILLVIIPQFTFYTINLAYWVYLENNPELDPMYEPEFSLTVWITPEEEEFSLHLDFYGSEQDAYSKVNRFEGHGIPVRPFDDEENNCVLYAVPANLVSVWVKIYFNEETEEPFIILRIDLQHTITTTLQGREISILIEPWFGEDS